MRVRIALIAVPVGAALVANFGAIALSRLGDGTGPDGGQALLWTALAIVGVAAIGVALRNKTLTGTTGPSAWLGFAAGVLAFVLSWLPIVTLLLLEPPS